MIEEKKNNQNMEDKSVNFDTFFLYKKNSTNGAIQIKNTLKLVLLYKISVSKDETICQCLMRTNSRLRAL